MLTFDTLMSSQSLFKQYVAQQLDMIMLASLGTLEEESIGGKKFLCVLQIQIKEKARVCH